MKNQLKKCWKEFVKNGREIVQDQSGIGTVEVILILVVLVALVLLFKKEITSIANSIFTNISNSVNKVY